MGGVKCPYCGTKYTIDAPCAECYASLIEKAARWDRHVASRKERIERAQDAAPAGTIVCPKTLAVIQPSKCLRGIDFFGEEGEETGEMEWFCSHCDKCHDRWASSGESDTDE